jgi:FkbM family methyltransferase
MSQRLRAVPRTVAVRLGQEQRAREVIGRLREVRGVIDGTMRRELRDDHAVRVVLATALGSGDNAIDIGANRGAVLEQIVTLAPNGHHIAYEPLPDLRRRLEQEFPQVDVRAGALSDESGTAEFVHVIDAPAFSGLRKREDLADDARVERISVSVECLDDALDADYVPSLIKIDVEGAEVKVIRGAAATIERHRPYVLFEHGVGGADLYGSASGELFDLLDGAGLRIFDLDGNGPFARGQFEEQFTQPVWNWLAAPR